MGYPVRSALFFSVLDRVFVCSLLGGNGTHAEAEYASDGESDDSAPMLRLGGLGGDARGAAAGIIVVDGGASTAAVPPLPQLPRRRGGDAAASLLFGSGGGGGGGSGRGGGSGGGWGEGGGVGFVQAAVHSDGSLAAPSLRVAVGGGGAVAAEDESAGAAAAAAATNATHTAWARRHAKAAGGAATVSAAAAPRAAGQRDKGKVAEKATAGIRSMRRHYSNFVQSQAELAGTAATLGTDSRVAAATAESTSAKSATASSAAVSSSIRRGASVGIGLGILLPLLFFSLLLAAAACYYNRMQVPATSRRSYDGEEREPRPAVPQLTNLGALRRISEYLQREAVQRLSGTSSAGTGELLGDGGGDGGGWGDEAALGVDLPEHRGGPSYVTSPLPAVSTSPSADGAAATWPVPTGAAADSVYVEAATLPPPADAAGVGGGEPPADAGGRAAAAPSDAAVVGAAAAAPAAREWLRSREFPTTPRRPRKRLSAESSSVAGASGPSLAPTEVIGLAKHEKPRRPRSGSDGRIADIVATFDRRATSRGFDVAVRTMTSGGISRLSAGRRPSDVALSTSPRDTRTSFSSQLRSTSAPTGAPTPRPGRTEALTASDFRSSTSLGVPLARLQAGPVYAANIATPEACSPRRRSLSNPGSAGGQ